MIDMPASLHPVRRDGAALRALICSVGALWVAAVCGPWHVRYPGGSGRPRRAGGLKGGLERARRAEALG